MTVERYLELMPETWRGHLADGFPDEVTEDMKAPRNNDTTRPIGERVRPALTEDLSGLNDKRWLRSRETGAVGGKAVRQRWRGPLTDVKRNES